MKGWGWFGLITGILITLVAIERGVSVYQGLWPHIFFLVGTSLFFDAIHYLVCGESLLHRIWKHKHLFLVPFMAGLSIELLLDVAGVFLFLTWIYPMFNREGGLFLYVIFAPLGLLFLYESYTAVTALVRKGFHSSSKLNFEVSQNRRILNLMGFFSVLLFLFSMTLMVWSDLNRWYIHYFVGFGVWSLLEYIGLKRGQETLVTHILRKDFIPLLVIFFLSFTLAYGWEVMNVSMGGSWIYTNLPEGAIILSGGVPLIALLQWPFLYIMFLSFYRSIFLSREEPCFW
ncbi:MAG: hypothetical protein AABX70_00675 [Nanoarchaeota archaeon]